MTYRDDRDAAARERLDALIRASGQGYAAISRLVGKNPAYIQQYIKRGVPRRLGETERQLISLHFGVSEHLLGAPGPPQLAPKEGAEAAVLPGAGDQEEDVLRIPYLDPLSRLMPAKVDYFLFDSRAVASLSHGRPKSLAALVVEGDAMTPTLSEGDRVLIDIHDRRALRDGVYAIRTEGALLLRRLSVNPVTGRISILTDNASYPTFPDCDRERITVIGRIQWVGRRLA